MSHAAAAVSAENQLLIAAAHVGDTGAPPTRDLDWRYVQQAADRQGVLPLLYRWLGAHPDVPVPADVMAALHEAYWRGHFRNRLLFDELRHLTHEAGAAGLAFMPLKGALLAPQFYPKPALRPLSDLDLLVHPRDIAAFGSLLSSMGYSETRHSPSYVDDEWLDLDSRDYCYFVTRPGVDVFIEYRVAPLELAVARLTDLDAAYTDALRRHARDVWSRATPVADATLHRQSAEDLLLHVTTHLAAKHLDFRLIWLHDIAAIVKGTPGLDWGYVAAQSAALRVAAPVAAALEAARRHVGAPIDGAQIEDITRTLGRPSRLSLARRDLARLRQHVATLPERDLRRDGPWGWPLGGALSRVRGWQARLRILRWVLLPGHDYLAHRGTAGRGRMSRVTGSLTRLVRRRAASASTTADG